MTMIQTSRIRERSAAYLRCGLLAAIMILSMGFNVLAADCGITLRGVRDVRFRGTASYDIYAPTETAQTVLFSVRHKASGDSCSYFVTFSKGQSGSYDRTMLGPGGTALRYQIYDTPSKVNVLKDIPEAFAAEVLSGSFSDGLETQEKSYYVAIPPGQIVADGSYQDNILLTLYEGTLTTYTQRDSAAVAIITNVNKSLQMCVVGCGAPFDPFSKSRTMNFGVLQAGASREVDLLVRGNVNYEVFFASDNRGTMANQLIPGSTVAYAMTVNGTTINLDQNRVTVATATGPTPTDGDRYHVIATIGSLAGSLAGEYRDNISITVRSQ